MIDLPIGKVLVAVVTEPKCNNECANIEYRCPNKICECCKGCDLDNEEIYDGLDSEYESGVCEYLCCFANNRRDGKNVIYKLVDYP